MLKADPDIRAYAKTNRRNLTSAEAILWSCLKGRQLGWQFRRQHPVGRYIADFACAKAGLIVEVDGATHGSDRDVAYDASRTEFLESRDWTVYRVWTQDIYDNLNGVIEGIAANLPPPFMDNGDIEET